MESIFLSNPRECGPVCHDLDFRAKCDFYGSCSSGEEIEAQMKGFAQGYVVTLQLN